MSCDILRLIRLRCCWRKDKMKEIKLSNIRYGKNKAFIDLINKKVKNGEIFALLITKSTLYSLLENSIGNPVYNSENEIISWDTGAKARILWPNKG